MISLNLFVYTVAVFFLSLLIFKIYDALERLDDLLPEVLFIVFLVLIIFYL